MHIHSRARNFALAALLIAAAVTGPASAQDEELIVSHGISTFGALKYPEGFAHFDYVNPDAPKGGIYHSWDLGSYDSLTPFTEKGNAAEGAWGVFDGLMTGALDTLDEMYGLIAESATWPPDKHWISFKMRPEARFSDGSPLTAEDVVFTFDKMQNEGQYRYRAYFGDIEKVEALGFLFIINLPF
jgi:microcin C transport system substrate-binding protein